MKSYDEISTPGMIVQMNSLTTFANSISSESHCDESLDQDLEFWLGRNKWGIAVKIEDRCGDGQIPLSDYERFEKTANRFCHRFERDPGAKATHKILGERNDDKQLGFDELKVVIEPSQNADFGDHRIE